MDCKGAMCGGCEAEEWIWRECDACGGLICDNCSVVCDSCYEACFCDACSADNLFQDGDEEDDTFCGPCFQRAHSAEEEKHPVLQVKCSCCGRVVDNDPELRRCTMCEDVFCLDCMAATWRCKFSACARCPECVCKACATCGAWRCGTCSVCGQESCSSCSEGAVACDGCGQSYACGACQAQTAPMQRVHGKIRCVACALRCKCTT